MLPEKIIKDGMVQRIICNYYPYHDYHHLNHNLLFYGNLRPIALSNDIILIKRQSLLFQKIFEYQQLMVNTVHPAYKMSIKKNYHHHQITIPLAAFLNGIFINNDDARRFYQWLKLTLR